MIGLSAFKRNKPRQFNYEPRYFDPKKEEREARQRALGIIEPENAEDDKYIPGSYIKSKRVRRMLAIDEDKDKKNSLKVGLIRFIIAMVLLLLLAYFIINFKGLELLVK